MLRQGVFSFQRQNNALGQLTRVNDPNDTTAGASGTTWVYEYDFGGNIKKKTPHPYTTGTPSGGTAINYGYDTTWKDKLVSYDGKSMVYDEIGNLKLFDGWEYFWEGGRQLKEMKLKDNNGNTIKTVQFKYNHNGLRTQKTVVENGITTYYDYTLHGKLITHLTKRVVNSQNVETDREELHFFYDSQSKPAFVEYGGAMYRYVHNLQGDIVAIVDEDGNAVVEYKYDAWGKSISTTGSLAGTLGNLNPFRYRGYVWDVECGLYYLRSRFYSLMCIRFINADTVLGKVGTLSSRNMFVYCGNNPVMKADPDGATDEPAVKSFFRKRLSGYDGGLDTVLDSIVDKWNNRAATEKALREEYNIPESAKCVISYNVKEVTSFDKRADYIAGTAFGALLGIPGKLIGSIAGGSLGLMQADEDSPDVGMYAGITYSFTNEYRVISGDIDNHVGMECQAFTSTWIIEEYTNGVKTYFDVEFDDSGIGQTGIFVDLCNFHP